MSKGYDRVESALQIIATSPTSYAFALCKLPNREDYHLTWQPNHVRAREISLTEIGREPGFVVAPFEDKNPICLISGEMLVGHVEELSHKRFHSDFLAKKADRSAYTHAFESCKEALKRGFVKKVVLSKVEDYVCRESVDVLALFADACRNYSQQYVALWHVEQTGLWLVATPEPLLLAHEGHIETVALAGTRWNSTDAWDTKNSDEQAMVAHYITQALSPYVEGLTFEGPTTVYAGHLAHLRTTFSAHCCEDNTLGELLSALHPTPAVCGLPKEAAHKLITAVETHERAYYTGFSGLIRNVGHADCYVTLRCMRLLYEDDIYWLRLYAGGGLLQESEEATEWQETECKLQTMRHLLGGA